MPTRKNFRNAYRKSTERKNMFENPKQMLKSSEMSRDRKKRIKDWITFYRRNMPRFIEHYFGIKLHPYQIFWVYWMSVCDTFMAICSRAVGKTWLLGVFACAKAVLYPRSEIVIVSSTKEQAGIIVTDKIASLYNEYPNLAREISNITTNMNKWQVDFHNGSVIKVVASRDSARGKRATFSIYEEFPHIDKDVIDSVIRRFSYVRQAPYIHLPLYKHLIEEPKEVFISSAYHKGLWWFDEMKQDIISEMKGENTGVIFFDVKVALRHNIVTVKQIKKDLAKTDEITALEEIYNIPYGESSTAYFKLKMFDRARNVKRAFYPQRMETYNPKRNPYGILKTEGELRIVSCDVAQKGGNSNDLSVTSLYRLLPTRRGYFRECVYMESFSGVNSIKQSLRIKQVFYDFDADYLVLDVGAGGGGIPMYDMLGQITRDDDRGIEYPPWTIMQDSSIDNLEYDELSKRTLGINALPIVYPISANAKSNSFMYIELRDALQKKLYGFLCDEGVAEDNLIRSSFSKEFLDHEDSMARSFFLNPHIQQSLMINECINLSMSMVGGNIKLTEGSSNRKDRFSSLLYANHLACIYDKELLRYDDDTDDWGLLQNMTVIF